MKYSLMLLDSSRRGRTVPDGIKIVRGPRRPRNDGESDLDVLQPHTHKAPGRATKRNVPSTEWQGPFSAQTADSSFGDGPSCETW